MTTGLGINAMPDPNNNGSYIGRLPRDERRVIAAQFPNTGVINTPVITTSASAMTYKVGANVVVASRGASDGSTIFPVDETTLTVAPTAGNPRIDVIYAYQHDYEQGDADNKSGYGVVQGTASASPTEPAVPANTQRVAAMRLPANASTTTGATQVNGVVYAVPYGGSLGTLVDVVDKGNGNSTSSWVTTGQGSFYLPTRRLIRIESLVTGVWVNPVVSQYVLQIVQGTVNVNLLVDGEAIRFLEFNLSPQAQSHFYAESVEVDAGTHTVAMQIKNGVSGFKRYWSSGGFAGQRLRVIDEGVA